MDVLLASRPGRSGQARINKALRRVRLRRWRCRRASLHGVSPCRSGGLPFVLTQVHRRVAAFEAQGPCRGPWRQLTDRGQNACSSCQAARRERHLARDRVHHSEHARFANSSDAHRRADGSHGCRTVKWQGQRTRRQCAPREATPSTSVAAVHRAGGALRVHWYRRLSGDPIEIGIPATVQGQPESASSPSSPVFLLLAIMPYMGAGLAAHHAARRTRCSWPTWWCHRRKREAIDTLNIFLNHRTFQDGRRCPAACCSPARQARARRTWPRRGGGPAAVLFVSASEFNPCSAARPAARSEPSSSRCARRPGRAAPSASSRVRRHRGRAPAWASTEGSAGASQQTARADAGFRFAHAGQSSALRSWSG